MTCTECNRPLFDQGEVETRQLCADCANLIDNQEYET